MLRRCAGLIFHTQEMYELAREAVGVGPRWACVVAMFSMRTGRVNSPEDEVVRTGRVNHPENEVAVPAIVVPASYASDEPIHEILRAAALCPGIAFVFTGKAPPSVVAAAPANVVLTGWLSEAEYSKCVASCAAVLCLTTRSATMQNGLVEALEHGRPAIVSGTDTLRRLAEEIPGIMAIADHAPDTVARAVVTLTSDVQGWRARAASGFSVAAQRFERELADLRDHMALLSDGYGDRSTYRDTGAP
jgi:glycosyltransferase involved in cell wall biosynthesis